MSSWAAPRPAATTWGRGRPVMKAVQLELDCRFESSAPDLKRSGQELLPEAVRQRSNVHLLRNAPDDLSPEADDDGRQELDWLYDRPNLNEAHY